MSPDLFPCTKPPRAKPRVLMHVIDAGDQIAKFKCASCGAESEWLPFSTITEAKRGIPCEACNSTANPTIPVSMLGNARMAAGGEKRVSLVIHAGEVKEWTGIGWIPLREPTDDDRATIPQAVYHDGSPA